MRVESGQATRELTTYLLARFGPVVHPQLVAELLDDDDPGELRREVGSKSCEESIPLLLTSIPAGGVAECLGQTRARPRNVDCPSCQRL
jgi:hypothetical protein